MTDNNENPTDSSELRLWEKQEYETQSQYNFFADWYLHLPAPRYIINAYRAYMAKRRNVPVNDPQIQNLSKLPSTWQRMAFALDSKNRKRTDGALPWKKRAAAYDAYMIRSLNEMTERRRIDATFAALDTIDEMLAKWQEMFNIAKILRTTSRHEIDEPLFDNDGSPVLENGKPKKVTKIVEIRALNTGQFRGVVKTFDDLRTLQRRELGQAAEIRQNNLADSEGENLSILPKGFADLLTDAYQDIQDYKKRRNMEGENSENFET